jgi:carbonic anhydrase/acetyltransferase-like protein (isoleucine patch superfamily)
MSSTILDGSVVKRNSMLAAGSLLTQGKIIKSGELWAGKPAKFLRKLSINETKFIKKSAKRYYKLSQEYLVNLNKNN